MTTSTPTQKQVQDAQNRAAELAAQLTEAEARREARVDEALAKEAARRYVEHDAELQARRDQAWQALTRTIGKPEATTDELWTAFLAYRSAGATLYRLATYNAGQADMRLGMARTSIGTDSPRPRPASDATAALTFADVLEQHTAAIASAAVAEEMRNVEQREDEIRQAVESDPEVSR